MKKLLFLITAFVLLPLPASAQLPFAEGFQKVADRLGIARDRQAQILEFTEGLEDDMVINCSITSVYPPVMDIAFASGKEIHADGDLVLLIAGADDVIKAEEVCPVTFVLGVMLAWTGFFLLSLPLLTAGAELLIITAIICL